MEVKRAIVTGASSGIGLEFSRQLAERGYRVLAVARREDRLRSLVDDLPGDGHGYLCADLATEEGMTTVCETMRAEHCHLLVNNAGFSILEPFFESSIDTQTKILTVNCQSLVRLAHCFLGQAKSGDTLVNMASVVAYLPTPAQPMYSASKAFVASFSECLWSEHEERGVYVMGLCPGMTETEFLQVATQGEAGFQNVPAAVMQTARQVVNEAFKALERRKRAIVVTGRFNRFMVRIMPRLLTRHRLIKTLAVMGDPERVL